MLLIPGQFVCEISALAVLVDVSSLRTKFWWWSELESDMPEVVMISHPKGTRSFSERVVSGEKISKIVSTSKKIPFSEVP
jgi:hypothetical protein